MTKYQSNNVNLVDPWSFLKSLFNKYSGDTRALSDSSTNTLNNSGGASIRYTLINRLLRQVGDFESSPFYQLGEADGKIQGDFTEAIETIENTFDVLIQSESEIKILLDSELRYSKKRANYLSQAIKRLENDLDQNKPQSKINLLREEIKRLKDKIETHYANRFQDSFVLTHNAILEKRYNAEKVFIDKLEESRNQLHTDMTDSLSEMTNRLKLAIKTYGKETSGEIINHRVQYSWMDGFQVFTKKVLQQFSQMNRLATKELNRTMADSIHRYKELTRSVKMDAILVPSRFKIISTFILFCVILLGEIYLVYKVTSETLGMDPASEKASKMDNVLFFKIALVIFCIAYPITIGMAAKNYITHAKNRHRAIRNINFIIGILVLLTILSISLLNPTVPGSIIPSLHQDPFSLPGNLRQALYSIVFFGITTMFSVIAGLLYVEFTESYERFVNIRKERLIQFPFFSKKFDKHDPVEMLNQRIKEKEAVIEQLRNDLDSSQKELAHIETISEINLKNWKLAAALSSLKQASVGAYKLGYQRSLHSTLNLRNNKPEAFINLFRNKKLLNHFLSLFGRKKNKL